MQGGGLSGTGLVGEPVAGRSQQGSLEWWHGFLGPLAAPVVGVEPVAVLPAVMLDAPSPNPCAARCGIAWRAPAGARTSVAIFDAAGRRVRRLAVGPATGGESRIDWRLDRDDGRRVQPGLYFVRLGADAAMRVRRLVVVP